MTTSVPISGRAGTMSPPPLPLCHCPPLPLVRRCARPSSQASPPPSPSRRGGFLSRWPSAWGGLRRRRTSRPPMRRRSSPARTGAPTRSAWIPPPRAANSGFRSKQYPNDGNYQTRVWVLVVNMLSWWNKGFIFWQLCHIDPFVMLCVRLGHRPLHVPSARTHPERSNRRHQTDQTSFFLLF